MRTTLAVASLSALVGLTGCPHGTSPTHSHWTYEGAEGPEAWGHLSPEFGACSSGKAQSPVDLAGAVSKDLAPLAIDWKPSKVSLTNNGHTVQQAVAAGSSLELGGVRYQLAQWHLHHPSEHALGGKRLPARAAPGAPGPGGALAVVGVFVEAGAENPALAALVKALPAGPGATAASEATVDPGALLPRDRTFFSYVGSLTTPPCTEGVRWNVLKTPVTASPAPARGLRAPLREQRPAAHAPARTRADGGLDALSRELTERSFAPP